MNDGCEKNYGCNIVKLTVCYLLFWTGLGQMLFVILSFVVKTMIAIAELQDIIEHYGPQDQMDRLEYIGHFDVMRVCFVDEAVVLVFAGLCQSAQFYLSVSDRKDYLQNEYYLYY